MTYFKSIDQVKYEGYQSTNPFAFKYYNPEEVIGGKTMEEHLRFSVAFWHTFTANGTDPFGAGNMVREWDRFSGIDLAKARVEAAFEFFEKLNIPYFAFHDVDIAPEGDSLAESNRNLDEIVSMIKDYMKTSKTKLLWNTANMFTHPRFVHGAATTNSVDVYAYAAAKVKKMLEVGKELGAENYVFWGGREGYETLLNTDVKFELDNLARFYHMAIDYAKEIGFDAQFLIEPKPKEPTTHQYDTDVQTATAFLHEYDLIDHFKFNIEANHATLAGHTFDHELRFARETGLLGSVDANQGDLLIGWDTDEFPTDLYSTTLAMYEILKNDGLGKGGLNFDAKVRRGSFEMDDLIHAHIAGMDSFAIGLKVANKLIEDKFFENILAEKYGSFKGELGQKIVSNKASFKELEAHAKTLDANNFKNVSGKTEYIRSRLNQYLLSVNEL